jgi:hypothetical protein
MGMTIRGSMDGVQNGIMMAKRERWVLLAGRLGVMGRVALF